MKKLLTKLFKLLPLAFLLVGTFSYAQVPPLPKNPYPWTEQAQYSPQYYNWEPLRYFGPKYSGYLNQEEASVFVARSLSIPADQKSKIRILAEKIGIPVFSYKYTYKTGVSNLASASSYGLGSARIVGSVRRNDAQSVDLQVIVEDKDKKLVQTIGEKNPSEIFNYSLKNGTADNDKNYMLPFVFDVEFKSLEDVFSIKDPTTNQVLFGPMTFESLGDIEKLEKPFEDSWYYIVTDGSSVSFPLEKSKWYSTESECRIAVTFDLKRTSKDPNCYQDGGFAQKYDVWWFYYKTFNPKTESILYKNEVECKKAGKDALKKDVICYTKHIKTIDVDLVTDNNFVVGNEVDKYSKITNTSAHLLFRVDTYGSTAKLGVYYRKYSDVSAEPTLVNIHDSVHSDFGKSVIVTSDITGLTKNTKYQIYVIDQSDLEGVKDSDGKPMTVSKVKKLFEGTIITKEVHSFIKNTMPVLSDKLAPNFDLKGIFEGKGGSRDLRIITCGYNGANITTVDPATGKLVIEPGKIPPESDRDLADTDPSSSGSSGLLKPDSYFDKNDDGKIDGDGRAIGSEWKEVNGKKGFQPHGETCDFNDIIGIIRRVQKYILTLVPLFAAGMFAYAGFLYLTGGAKPAKIKEAHDIIWYTVIGIVVVLLAWLVVANIYVLLGIDKSWSWLKL